MSLLRRPGATMSPDQMTNDAVLDGFLQNLDAALIGSRKVRALHLAEAKDHLMEAKELHAAQGADSEAASNRAVYEFGEVQDHAQAQRHLVWARFWQTAMTTGPFFGVAMFAFALLDVGTDAGSVTKTLVTSIIQGVFFGLAMGWFLAFVHPPKTLPSSWKEGRFVCAYSSGMRNMSYFCMLIFAACAVMGIGVAFGIEALNPLGFSKPAAIILGLLAISNIRSMRTGIQRLVVDESGIEVHRLFGHDQISWSQLRSLTLLGERKTWIPTWNYWSRVHVVEYAAPSGSSRAVNIFPDAENSDRVVCLVRDRLSARGAEPNRLAARDSSLSQPRFRHD